MIDMKQHDFFMSFFGIAFIIFCSRLRDVGNKAVRWICKRTRVSSRRQHDLAHDLAHDVAHELAHEFAHELAHGFAHECARFSARIGA